MIIRTEAIVLRSMKYGETSRIVTLFTREQGKIAVLAKGARLTRSRFGSTLQPMSYIQVVYYYKASRGLQILSESAHVETFHDIGRDLEKISTGLRIVELVHALLHESEQNAPVFNLLLQVLYRLDHTRSRVNNIVPYFNLRLATILGFSPNIDRDRVKTLPADGGLLSLDTGAVLHGEALPESGRYASRAALRAFAIFARADLNTVMKMRLSAEEEDEVHELVEGFMRYHFQDSYPSRSNKVIGQMSSENLLPEVHQKGGAS